MLRRRVGVSEVVSFGLACLLSGGKKERGDRECVAYLLERALTSDVDRSGNGYETGVARTS
jgi:hypothetical protein